MGTRSSLWIASLLVIGGGCVASPSTEGSGSSFGKADGQDRCVENLGWECDPLEFRDYIKPPTQGGAGFSVSVDGDLMVVGAPVDLGTLEGITKMDRSLDTAPDLDAERSGAVWVYRRSSDGWAPEAYIKATTDPGTAFGTAVDVQNNTILVGAPGATAGAGAAFV